MTNKPNLIVTKSLSKTYSPNTSIAVQALKNANLIIKHGEFVAIMGASGSGKSTLLNLLGCLDTPSSGDFYFNDELINPNSDLPKIRREKIGFIFQSFNLIPQLNARENIEVPMIYKGLSKREREEKSLSLLAEVDLLDRGRHFPEELSGGQKQRVAIARALANNPQLIIADEPTGNLDSITSKIILDLLRELNKKGITLIMVTHENEIGRLADRIIRLSDGIIEQ